MNPYCATETGYRYGCRCTECKQAHSNGVSKRSQRRKRTVKQRLPFEPIIALFDDESTNSDIADAIGCHPSAIKRYRTEGMSLDIADRVAIRLGFHPLVIWGSEYWKAT